CNVKLYTARKTFDDCTCEMNRGAFDLVRRLTENAANLSLYFDESVKRQTWSGFWRHVASRRLSETNRYRLFLWVPVCFAAGIGIYFLLAREPSAAMVIAIGLVAIAAKLIVRNGTFGLAITFAALCVALGFANAKLRTEMVRTPKLTHKIGPVTMTGRVVEAERRRPSGQRVTFRVLSLGKLSKRQTPARVRLTLAGRNARLRVGEAVSLRAVLRPPPEPVMPGGFNFARCDWFRQIGAVGYAVSKPEMIRHPEPLPLSLRLSAIIDTVRQAVSRRIRTNLPERIGKVADALITGQRRAIDRATMEALRRSGLAHVLAISGLHMALIAGTLFWLVRAVLAMNCYAVLKFPIKKIAAIAAMLGGGFYLVLSGAAISTERAYIMIAIMFLAICLQRPAISLRNVALAALAILVPWPESLLDVGFQMSFAAVVALVAVYENAADRTDRLASRSIWGRRLGKLGTYFFGIGLTTLVASAAVAPFSAFHFHQFAHYGLFANLAAMPVVGVIIMPAVLMSLIAMPFGLEAWPLSLMATGIDHLLTIAETVSKWPGAVSPVPAMPSTTLILIAFGGLWICLWQSTLRFFGLFFIALDLVLAPNMDRPDILIDREAKVVAVRTADGELTALPGRKGEFSLDRWLKADADRRDGQDVRRSRHIRCDMLGCIARVKGKMVAIIKHPQALAEDCVRGAIVISQLRSASKDPQQDCPGAALFIGTRDLRRNGAHAIFIGEARIRTQSVTETLGNRPWVLKRPAQPSGKSKRPGRKRRSKSNNQNINSGA
ncbi:MAG: ComEC/Rec2 family competence protein, partial [Methyloligellaceae bacterium]